MAHSKRNTSLAFFTAHERAELRGSWGSQGARLNRDSFLPFGSCSLCLLPATDPVACRGGQAPVDAPTIDAERTPIGRTTSKLHIRKRLQCHVFCRECAMSNLLQQRKEFKRLEREGAIRRVEEDARDARDDEEADHKAVEDFERVQQGLDVKLGSTGRSTRAVVGRKDGKIIIEETNLPKATGSTTSATENEGNEKRKFDMDEEELVQLAQDERVKARRTLRDEKAEAAKSTLPSFWVPSLTPGQNQPDRTEPTMSASVAKKQQPICPGSTLGAPHTLSLKTLVPVVFTEEKHPDDSNGPKDIALSREGKTRVCPACSRPLTNASKAVLAKPCGHVLCAPCIEKFVAIGEDNGEDLVDDPASKTLRCFVCSIDISEAKSKKSKDKLEKGVDRERIKPGLVDICSEGTGFAGGGTNVVKRHGVAFQC